MKKLTLEPDMHPDYRAPALRAFDVIPDNFLEVCARQAYIRITAQTSHSLYYWPEKDHRILVDIEGKRAISQFLPYAEMYWGATVPRVDRNGKKYYYWRMDADRFFATVSQVMSQQDLEQSDAQLIDDIDGIYAGELTSYEKKVLAKQRIGHSRFAYRVKQRANNACQLSPQLTRNLIASHIKPWAESLAREKLDIANGLCLSPNADGLFEDGLISFTDEGLLLAQPLSAEERQAYGLSNDSRIKLAPGQQIYLAWHRAHKYQADEH